MTDASGGVDVAQLMAEIKERVRQRRASGFYSDDEVRRIAQMELEVAEVLPAFHEEVEHHLGVLNDAWDVLRDPAISSHRPALGSLIVGAKRLWWRLARPYSKLVLQRQIELNTAVVHLLNAFVLPVRDRLKDGMAGLQRKIEELSLAMHERLTAEHAEALKRHLELARRVDGLVGELVALRTALDRTRGAAGVTVPPPSLVVPADAGRLPAEAYLKFEDRHRGSREEIRQRQKGYLDLFAEGPLLDVGCGRGEFLELCREVKVEARGIDTDPAMVAACREAGLEVAEADALAYLGGLTDGSLGGVFCSQVIEHLPPEAFIALVRLAHAKLKPGGVLLCETPNPECLTVFSGAFYVDLTHLKPIHPQAAVFVLEAAGFRDVEVRYVNPYPPEAGLQPLEPLWYMRRYEEAFLTALNDNFKRLNQLLWGAQDYGVIGRKP
ncbi:MAG TPA: class I SAM-dependent methyltransferase [Methylomirabilota bacterium]|jgi:O-antigen chain-terminating methyltransferase|nr:class I SAM-dependent methyltransferase [Methylomirabilota bacterium]